MSEYCLNGLKGVYKYGGSEDYVSSKGKSSKLHKLIDRDGNSQRFTYPKEFDGEVGTYYTCEFVFTNNYIKSKGTIATKLNLISMEPYKTKTK